MVLVLTVVLLAEELAEPAVELALALVLPAEGLELALVQLAVEPAESSVPALVLDPAGTVAVVQELVPVLPAEVLVLELLPEVQMLELLALVLVLQVLAVGHPAGASVQVILPGLAVLPVPALPAVLPSFLQFFYPNYL